MKFTWSWLKEYLDTNATLDEITECLTQIGLEVENIEDKSSQLKDFNVVEVTEVEKHPDADRLNICSIKTEKEEFKLICGANNVSKNMKAILAPLGSIIPSNQMKVKKVKIRGIESIGMLCSARELELGTDHDGIIEVDKSAKIGTNIASILGIDDPVIEIAITPNRGDCLGVQGIARDLAAAGKGKLRTPQIPKIKPQFNTNFTIQNNSSDCRELNLLEIKGVKNTSSPTWLVNKIQAVGIQPKSAIIDITNYILYCFGQPLHAYDKNLISGNVITIENTEEEKNFTALNDEEYSLPKQSLTIKDKAQIISLAGIIGGKSSACNDNSTDIILEAANFAAKPISATGRKLQIDTDSRYRFERKIDPLFVQNALYKAASLIQEICGGEISNIVQEKENIPSPKMVILNLTELNNIAARDIEGIEVEQILQNLGFKILEKTKEDISVEPPSWRNDIAIEADLIEEILRLRGFDKIPYVSFQNKIKKETNYLDLNKELSIKRLLASLGLHEVITWSFFSKKESETYNLPNKLQIQNPISNDLSIMRSSLIPNLVNIAIQEQNKGNNISEIFEYGKVFDEQENITQTDAVASIRVGKRNIKELNNSDQDYDIFDVKTDILSILKFLNIAEHKLNLATDNLPEFLHPKRSAKLHIGKNMIGYFGELHPAIAKTIGIKQRLNLCELFLSNIPKMKHKAKIYNNVELQPLNRDFCFIVSDDIPSGDIKKEILKTDSSLIKEVKIFDLYKGEKLEDGKKSLAFNVILQPKETSLTSEELELFNQKVINHINKKFDAILP